MKNNSKQGASSLATVPAAQVRVYRQDDSYIPQTIIDVFKGNLNHISEVLITSIKSNFKTLAQLSMVTPKGEHKYIKFDEILTPVSFQFSETIVQSEMTLVIHHMERACYEIMKILLNEPLVRMEQVPQDHLEYLQTVIRKLIKEFCNGQEPPGLKDLQIKKIFEN